MVRAVWQHAAVTDDSLARCVSEVRTALGDLQRRMLKTVPRRGYVLTVPASRDVPGTAAEQPSLAVLPFMTLGADRVHR